jgi:hypothetical protein
VRSGEVRDHAGRCSRAVRRWADDATDDIVRGGPRDLEAGFGPSGSPGRGPRRSGPSRRDGGAAAGRLGQGVTEADGAGVGVASMHGCSLSGSVPPSPGWQSVGCSSGGGSPPW